MKTRKRRASIISYTSLHLSKWEVLTWAGPSPKVGTLNAVEIVEIVAPGVEVGPEILVNYFLASVGAGMR